MVNPSDIVLEEEVDPEQVLQNADRVQGVGFDKQHILSMSSKAILAQTENERKAAEGAAGSDDESGAAAMN